MAVAGAYTISSSLAVGAHLARYASLARIWRTSCCGSLSDRLLARILRTYCSSRPPRSHFAHFLSDFDASEAASERASGCFIRSWLGQLLARMRQISDMAGLAASQLLMPDLAVLVLP